MFPLRRLHLAALAAGLLSSAGGAQQGAGPDDTAPPPPVAAKHEFRRAPANARGVQRLADLRGRPVLVEFWGTR